MGQECRRSGELTAPEMGKGLEEAVESWRGAGCGGADGQQAEVEVGGGVAGEVQPGVRTRRRSGP